MNSEFLDEIARIYYDYELSTYLLIMDLLIVGSLEVCSS